MQIELPEQAGCDRTPGPPILGAGDQLARARPVLTPIQTLDRELQAKIASGPDIGPAERKKQIDLGRPLPDPLELQQFRQHRFIRQVFERGEVEASVAYRLREIARIPDLLSAESATLQLRLAEGQETVGSERSTEQLQVAEHRGGGIDRDLLFEDDVEKGRKARWTQREARRAGRLDDTSKGAVTARKVPRPAQQAMRRPPA